MRGHFSTYQGEGPQACWRQVKGLQRWYGEKGTAGLYRFRLRLVLRKYRAIKVVSWRVNFSSGALADFEGLLAVNRKICKR